jgi:hypothetical protein
MTVLTQNWNQIHKHVQLLKVVVKQCDQTFDVGTAALVAVNMFFPLDVGGGGSGAGADVRITFLLLSQITLLEPCGHGC